MSNDGQKVSVIVPVYNVESFLPRCIESILSQTYENFELLLIDDGSTDSSGELCDRYKAVDGRIKVYHKANGGLSDARNYGIARATGDYLMFVDSDDYVSACCLSSLFIGVCGGSDMSACGLEIRRNTEKPSCVRADSAMFKTFSHDEALRALLYDRISISACGKLYKRDLFEGISFPEGKLFEDVGTVGYIVDRCNQVSVTSETYYFYCMREGSICHETMTDRSFDRYELAIGFCRYVFQKYGTEYKDPVRRFSVCQALSVLRMDEPPSSSYSARIELLAGYVRANAWHVVCDPMSSSRDRFGCLSYLAGRKFYHFAWNLYAKMTHRS